jgi:starvation-inducible DNA-binding protein
VKLVNTVDSKSTASACQFESDQGYGIYIKLLNNSIFQNNMEPLFKLLSDTQSSLFVLFQKTWVYHWNVVGSDFHQLHNMFGDQYETMFEEIDRISEHMRYLGMRPLSSLSRVIEVSGIQEASSGISANEMVGQLMNDNKSLIEMLKTISKEAESQNSMATANLVQDLMETHGKFEWMLRSFLSL